MYKVAVKATEMFVQVAAVDESLLTELAAVRAVVDVRAHVCAQLPGVRERLSAVSTEERAVADGGVVPRHVQPKLAGALPDFAADGTSERPVGAVVLSHVLTQLSQRRKPLAVLPAPATFRLHFCRLGHCKNLIYFSGTRKF